MKVKISEIPEGGLTVSEKFNPAQMNLDTPQMRFTGAVLVTGHFERMVDTVQVEVEASAPMQEICGRCLAANDAVYAEGFHLDYSVKDQTTLDITEDVRQEIMLSYPVKILCREECRGLCPQCGVNWNEGSCLHAVAQA